MSVATQSGMPYHIPPSHLRWFGIIGVILILMGIGSMTAFYAAAVGIQLFLGWLLIAAGVVQLIYSLASSGERKLATIVLTSILYVAIGVILLAYPTVGTRLLSFFVGVFLLAEGVFKTAMSWRNRDLRSWGWLLASGLASILLGIFVLVQWPSNTVVGIGVIVGINLIVDGGALLLLAIGNRPSAARA